MSQLKQEKLVLSEATKSMMKEDIKKEIMSLESLSDEDIESISGGIRIPFVDEIIEGTVEGIAGGVSNKISSIADFIRKKT